MLLRSRELLGLPVVTKSGHAVGRLSGFEFEAESQTIIRYEVKRSLWKGLPLLIHRGQVVSIDAKRMIVDDGTIADSAVESITLRTPMRSEQPTVVASKQ